ncbi:hypothetical protein [Sphingobacterium lactis]|uniref:Uncharacterized protein n=2 Tax=Sphingobacterium lactis TaxID=797291 RepID=A0A1H6BQ68_9SPHI|nr:hypothetical protein [Sphingobacterium lactis]SEG62848.1 hypothetical protein SAMN05421877_11156 [Sphingobacterium lactis]
MAWRPKIKITKEISQAFANWVAQFAALILSRFLYMVLGRGSAKTTEIVVERLIAMVYDLPGAPIVWVSDTYSNLQKNVLPSVLEGLERKGFKEGVHFVLGKQPPEFSEAEKVDLPPEIREHFWKPYNRLVSYKHTMIFFTGLNITFGSLDRPASLAGRSYVHVIGDEVKYFIEHKIANLLKAVRGYAVKYGKSPFYRGHTFTTDMPNTKNIGEHDWILKQVNKMKKSAILRILKAAIVLNECIQERIYFQQKNDHEEAAKKLRTEERWRERWKSLRMQKDGQTLFFIASSLVNIDILTPDWFSDAIQSDLGDVDTAVLSLKSSLESGDRFYANIGEKHFYRDGKDARWAEHFGIDDQEDCRILTNLNRKKIIEVGLDFGNMISMTIGQPKPNNEYKILKFMYTLSPDWIPKLAANFREYFNRQEEKVINAYYDRAANNYKDAKVDLAQAFKNAIEFQEDGRTKTGWKVNLMSRNQGNIGQAEEYIFMQELFSGSNPKLPKIDIDFFECKQLKASLEGARTKIVPNKRGASVTTKDKTSEKFPIHRLPMESTNPSDSFKYLMMRREWRNLVKHRTSQHISESSVVG